MGEGPLVTLEWVDDRGRKQVVTLTGVPWSEGFLVDVMDFHRVPTRQEVLSLVPHLIGGGQWRLPGGRWQYGLRGLLEL